MKRILYIAAGLVAGYFLGGSIQVRHLRPTTGCYVSVEPTDKRQFSIDPQSGNSYESRDGWSERFFTSHQDGTVVVKCDLRVHKHSSKLTYLGQRDSSYVRSHQIRSGKERRWVIRRLRAL